LDMSVSGGGHAAQITAAPTAYDRRDYATLGDPDDLKPDGDTTARPPPFVNSC
jgi:hypothetical protein